MNGPGESKHANVGISLPGSGENPVAPVYIDGVKTVTLKGDDIAGEFQRQTEDLISLTQTYFNANADRLNATATRITVGGTIFVLYTVVTGFFGMNFGWLVDNIDTEHDFLLYGVTALVVPTVILLTLFWVKRRDWF